MLDIVLETVPETLQDKNLILSGKQYLNSICTVLSKMVGAFLLMSYVFKTTDISLTYNLLQANDVVIPLSFGTPQTEITAMDSISFGHFLTFSFRFQIMIFFLDYFVFHMKCVDLIYMHEFSR